MKCGLGLLTVLLPVIQQTQLLHAQDPEARETELTPIALSFAPSYVAVSADGKRACVWDRRRSLTDLQNLAIVDLDRHAVASHATLPDRIMDVVVDETVFVLTDKKLMELSSEKLELRTAIDISTQKGQLMLVGDRRLSVGPRSRFQLPDLTPIENYDHDVNSPTGWLDGRCGFGWISEGVLWDHTLSTPSLLIWPYEFYRIPWESVLQISARGPGPFQPSVATWHPFATSLRSPPVTKVLAATPSPDIAATLGLVQDQDGFHLTSFRLDNGQPIAHVKLTPADQLTVNRSPNHCAIATGADRFAVLLSGQLYAGSLKPLHPAPDSLPFYIRPLQSTFFLSIDGPTTVTYEAPGAIRFQLSGRMGGQDGRPLRASSQTGEFTLTIADSLDQLLSSPAGLAANLNQGRRLSTNDLKAEFYAGPSRSAFRRLFGREPQGLPLPVGVEVIAEGTDFETATLRHDFLVEVPLKKLEEALDRIYPAARSPWKSHGEKPSLTDYPPDADPPTGPEPLDRYQRQVWENTSPAVSGTQLQIAARRAKSTGDRFLQQRFRTWLAGRQSRQWSETNGRKTEGALVQYFAGLVTIRKREGTETTIDDSNLSDADREFLRRELAGSSAEEPEDWRQFVLAESVGAVRRFHSRHGFLPPRALTDDNAQPRLSWRVLLLPELGYQDLYGLFRFNEPWNSRHNSELLAFMPEVLMLDPESTSTGHTTLVTVSSPQSALPTTGSATLQAFRRESSSTVVFVEAVTSRAIEWTQPGDPELYELAVPSAVIRSRNGRTNVGLLDGTTMQISANTSRDDWRLAINSGDTHRLLPVIAP